MANRVAVNVLVDRRRLQTDAESFVLTLEQAGLQVDRTLSQVGVVSGSIVPSCLPKLRAVSGVEAVEPTREVHLAAG